MNIATAIQAHNNTELVIDTINAVKNYVSDNILIVIDGNSWQKWGKNASLPAHKVNGFINGVIKNKRVKTGVACYKNRTLGLMKAYEKWPEAEWFCDIEYDTLFVSDAFKEDLKNLPDDVWLIGNHLEDDACHMQNNMSMLQSIMQSERKIYRCLKLLGCCVFYRNNFIKMLYEMDFFNRLLSYTNNFKGATFPQYYGYDFGECLYPTVCFHLGGNVQEFASAHASKIPGEYHYRPWTGDYKKYLMRWFPEPTEFFSETTIIHPSKSLEHRALCRKKLSHMTQHS